MISSMPAKSFDCKREKKDYLSSIVLKIKRREWDIEKQQNSQTRRVWQIDDEECEGEIFM